MADGVGGEITKYGFRWGPIEVIRCTEIDGAVALRVETFGGEGIEVYSSPKGKSLRVFRDGKELKADG